MKRLIIGCAMCICVVSATVASADTLVLKDGTRIEVRSSAWSNGPSRSGVLMACRVSYPASEVRAVEFLTLDGAISRASNSGGLAVPAGTELVVRTVEAIDSQNARTNQTFGALIEQSVENGAGTVIVPEGSHARLIIRHLTSGGTTGSPEMAVDIQSIEVDGRTYAVNTTDLTLEGDTGIGKNKRTAQTTGGGALLGTIIGAIAGGGKGAAIGAVVGAAGGATAQVLTRGTDVRVPAETILRFQLDRAVVLQPER